MQATETQATTEAAATLAQFMGDSQMLALSEALEVEEGMYFVKTLGELASLLDTMPRTYDQDGKGDQAVAYLHYFMGGMDWYITERDMGEEQLQAYGLADLGMGCPEQGYIISDWGYTEGDADGFNAAMREFDSEHYA